jgi:hypothetical protein
MTRETGKPVKMSRNELNGLLGRIDFFLKESSCRWPPKRCSTTAA